MQGQKAVVAASLRDVMRMMMNYKESLSGDGVKEIQIGKPLHHSFPGHIVLHPVKSKLVN